MNGEIYMRKKAFWQQRNERKTNHNFFLLVILFVLVVFLLISIAFRKQELKLNSNINHLKSKFLNRTMRLHSYIKNYLSKEIYRKVSQSKRKTKLSPVTHCSPQEEEFYKRKYDKKFQAQLFFFCDSSSFELEIYYEFRFFKTQKEVAFDFTYISDLQTYPNETYCVLSGKSNLTLRTNYFPRCLEFKNLKLSTFVYKNYVNPEIILKYHMFKVVSNKINIYHVSTLKLTSELISEYNNMKGLLEKHKNNQKFITIMDNIIIYSDPYNKSDKYIRICNMLSRAESKYDNKFWLEINWNPKIQNHLCFDELKYIN
jgi:hypothetical protein